ncbi:MAG: hypothetical protein AUJ71_00845 [Candidatus Omnitrophica bacterium CG1_02_49_16]|nr:MAG: hypothetical protein AUJ71_00845 [Candidatus Omnitrophica bacterium CG1_02_49_16]
MPKDDFFLSKSKYLAGLQCPKLLWTHVYAKEKIPPVDPETQALFDQGHRVTEAARLLFPGGTVVEGEPYDYADLIKTTQALLSQRKPLYEAAFKYQRSFARADILKPNEDGSWDIFEVKSTTGVKEIHTADAAFQKYCYEGAGLKIRKVYLVYINNRYVKDGPIKPAELFIQEEITEQAKRLAQNVKNQLDGMIKILEQKKCPDIKIGLQCGDPYECPVKNGCWDFLPKESVFILNRIHKKKAFELVESGIRHIKDVPADCPLSASQRVQCDCHTNGHVKIDLDAIRAFVDEIQFPIYFLDFETVGPPVPFYDQSSPYQQVPFQFSLHILRDWGTKATHHAYLAETQADPRPELLARLKVLLKDKGTILSYNMSFELTRLRESVAVYPKYEPWFRDIEKRFMDLIAPFRKFDYYDPKQMGRTSIKKVFPALTGGSYEGLEIGDGGTASLEYSRVMFSEGIAPQDKARVLHGLEAYCQLDTQAMIDVLDVLKRSADRKD